VPDLHRLAVHVHAQLGVVRDDGGGDLLDLHALRPLEPLRQVLDLVGASGLPRFLDRRGEVAQDVGGRGQHPLAHVVVRDDHGDRPERVVAARVVAVVVRVDQVADGLVGQGADLLDDAGRHVLVLRVDDQHRLRSHQDADVAAASVQRVHAAAQRLQGEALVGLAVVVGGCRHGRGLLVGQCRAREQAGEGGEARRHDSTSGERIT
jgi:hypothetical protein